jgi:hypothetical protein
MSRSVFQRRMSLAETELSTVMPCHVRTVDESEMRVPTQERETVDGCGELVTAGRQLFMECNKGAEWQRVH